MTSSLIQDIDAASEAGFEGLELWWDKVKVYLQDHSTEELRQFLASRGLKPAAICPLTIWPFRDTEPARDNYCQAIERANAIECGLVIVCPDFQPARLTREQALDTHAAELATMAEQAKGYGVKLAIEPIGRHTLVPGPVEALALIDRAGAPTNVGLLMDTFHYFRSQVSLETLASIPIDKLWMVHVNDTEDGAIDELTDGSRLYPGLGVLPLREQLSLLKKRGYSGYASVEIFRREYWGQPPQDVARKAYGSLRTLLDSI
jgi:2-keto-myo-inositol isomerase